jgi:hypothetical protein
MQTIDLAESDLRTLNATLQGAATSGGNETAWEILNPGRACAGRRPRRAGRGHREGLDGLLLRRHEQAATVHVAGSVGPGVAENMMSGTVIVEGDASQYAGATGRGGLLVIKGNASARAAASR